jgi:hypothetical protein
VSVCVSNNKKTCSLHAQEEAAPTAARLGISIEPLQQIVAQQVCVCVCVCV